ncbi:RND family efflux transporter MFP subunit [Ochrobactrum daejeonense]|uniref:RND family efflux transporter MFP subunit n=1 Tax=Brucella daejeonensis TaxID=659015 RepID=A0A7W9AZX0_9HYPH|nr:efflux RND transporter periplasmic adaptor subunit [Brucella daejeonensis]MBB5703676.1 RND family efflux transporter MFP subunit [Brucella daejeonensis]
MRLTRVIACIAAIGMIGAAAGWYIWRPVPVSVVTPSGGDAAEVVYASGVVEPRTWAKVAPVVHERIVEQCNCEGERVAQGTVLARLDDSEVRAVLVELKVRLALARDELRRQSALFTKNINSQQSVDAARSNVDQLEAMVAGREAKLDSYVLRAPSAGVVLRRDGEVGEIAQLGSVLFWVGEPKPLIVIADVNEEDIPRVAVGQKALLKSDAFPGRNLDAVVDSITPKGDPVTKTYRVRLRLPDETPLMIGMSADVNIVIRVSRSALLVPSVAVDGAKVVVAENGNARQREIRVGIRGTAAVEVLSGVDEAARIISPYPTGLPDGARITISRDRES